MNDRLVEEQAPKVNTHSKVEVRGGAVIVLEEQNDFSALVASPYDVATYLSSLDDEKKQALADAREEGLKRQLTLFGKKEPAVVNNKLQPSPPIAPFVESEKPTKSRSLSS